MGISVWTTMGFKNRSFQGGTMQNSAQEDNAETENSPETSSVKIYPTSENILENMGTYMLANQIVLNNSLKETLNYIQSHAYDRRKRYVLGELWDSLGDYDKEDDYFGELIDFEPDNDTENIFAA